MQTPRTFLALYLQTAEHRLRNGLSVDDVFENFHGAVASFAGDVITIIFSEYAKNQSGYASHTARSDFLHIMKNLIGTK